MEALRLVSGPNTNLVQVKINCKWAGVCATREEANKICQQLGFELGAAEKSYTDTDIPFFEANCQGTEKHISECTFQLKRSCVGSQKAGIQCKSQLETSTCNVDEFQCDNSECIHINNLCDGQAHCGDRSDEDTERCEKSLQVLSITYL